MILTVTTISLIGFALKVIRSASGLTGNSPVHVGTAVGAFEVGELRPFVLDAG